MPVNTLTVSSERDFRRKLSNPSSFAKSKDVCKTESEMHYNIFQG